MRVDWILYDDITRFMASHKERLSDDELTTLNIVAGGYLVNDDLTREVIEDARRIMARHAQGENAGRPSEPDGFDPNDRAAIMAALADPDPDNPIAKAVAERLKDLTGRYWLHAEKLGRVPTELMLVRPQTAFDETVYRLHLEALADATGQTVKVVWVASDDEADVEPVAAE